MAAEPLLVVASEPNAQGYYPVRYRGREYALASEPRIELDYRDVRRGLLSELKLWLYEVPPEPPPAPPRRTRATLYGLRKPCKSGSS